MTRIRRLSAVITGAVAVLGLAASCGTATSATATDAGHSQTPTGAARPHHSAKPSSKPSPSKKPAHSSHHSKLIPPDAQAPASGACGKATGGIVTVTVTPDAPAPRCTSVSSKQRLKVVNATNRGDGKTITVTFGGFHPRRVPAGQATTFDRPFGQYLAPGVHYLTISGFAGHAAVWLR